MIEPEANNRVVYFNDRAVGETVNSCTAKQKCDQQKVYRFYNPQNGLKTKIYCQNMTIYPDSGIVVTVCEDSQEPFEEDGDEFSC